MKLLAAISACLFLGITSVHAEQKMTLKQFIDEYQMPAVKIAIGASGQTLAWVNAHLEADHKPKLYCQPDHLAITNEQYEQIVMAFITKHPASADFDWTLYPEILLNGLTETFPCE